MSSLGELPFCFPEFSSNPVDAKLAVLEVVFCTEFHNSFYSITMYL